MRRRTQLSRENNRSISNDQINNSDIRLNYLHLRKQIMESKYSIVGSLDLQSQRGSSRTHSKAPSIDSRSLNIDWRENISKRINATPSSSSMIGSNYSTGIVTNMALNNQQLRTNRQLTRSSSKESLNQNQIQNQSVINKNNGSSSFFTMAAVHHIFDNHKGPITRIRFANND
jgi:hypothetical protein